MTPRASLRVYLLSKAVGGPLVDVMRDDYALFRELECYAEAEAEQRRRRERAERHRSRRRKG